MSLDLHIGAFYTVLLLAGLLLLVLAQRGGTWTILGANIPAPDRQGRFVWTAVAGLLIVVGLGLAVLATIDTRNAYNNPSSDSASRRPDRPSAAPRPAHDRPSRAPPDKPYVAPRPAPDRG